MNTHLLALQLMAVQGLLGAFDTLYHHELTEALPRRAGAARELSIHAVRSTIYAGLFIGLAGWEWHGVWALVLLAVFGVEIVLTLWDFVVEDRTRLLPATERVTHTVLAMNGGAFIMLLVLAMPGWLAQPSAFAWAPHGWLSVFLALCGVGVGLSGVRDGLAAHRLRRAATGSDSAAAIDFGATSSTVLVTGGTGFIGQRLVKALLDDGHRVLLLTRQPKQAAWQFDGRVRCVAQMTDLAVSEAVDVIINLAGARILGWRWSAARRAVLTRSRVGVTGAVTDWIARAERKPRLLLSASAIGYYGIQRAGDNTPIGEDGAPQPIFMSTLCQQWEQAAAVASVHGTQVACMRFGLVLGRQGALPMMLLPVLLGLGGALGRGNQWLSWIHVDDLVRAIAFLMRQSPAAASVTAYNFTAPDSVTQLQFSRVAAAVHARPCLLPTPAWPMRLMLGEQADLLLEGQRVVPTRLLAAGFGFSHASTAAALADLK